MKTPIQFFLRCDDKASRFYAVEVHSTHRSFVRAVCRLGLDRKEAASSRAICCRFELKNPHPEHKQLGTIFFVLGDMGPEVVVHELTHAACGWARDAALNPIGPYRRRRPRTDSEELFAVQLQSLFEQFYRNLSAATSKVPELRLAA